MTTTTLDVPGVFNTQVGDHKDKKNYDNYAPASAVGRGSLAGDLNMVRIVACGRNLRQIGGEVARHFEDLDPNQKQNFMYMAQIVAGFAMTAGGALSLASGTTPVLAAGMIATGSLNGVRSGVQYLLRQWRASGGDRDQQTEMINSSLAALTNTPQALSGLSLAGITAVSSYGLRIMNKAREREDRAQSEKPSHDRPRQAKTISLHDIYRNERSLVHTFNHAVADVSRALDRLLGADSQGNRRIDQLPGFGMTGRGILQTAEGVAVSLMNPIAGAFIAGAGIVYTGAATLMRSADTAVNDNGSPKPPVVSHQGKTPRQPGNGFTLQPS